MILFARLALAAWTAGMAFILLVVTTWFATEWIAPAAGPVEFGADQAQALLRGLATAAAVLVPGGRRVLPVQPRPETCATPLARDPDNRAGERIREMSILAACLLDPRVIGTFESDLDGLQMLEAEHGRLLQAILARAEEAGGPEFLEAIREEAGHKTVDSVLVSPHVRVTPVFKHRGNLEVAVSTLAESLAKLQSERGLRLEIEEAAEEIGQGQNEYVTYRLAQAAEARNRAERAHMEKDSAFDIAENGARLDRDERDAFRRLLDQLPLGESGKNQ
ncbi:hypothetical protein [Mangrovicoccus ximenensis]|uniref:hypothetical protein n=1 Tax=Mangrovicoccus ximenensis TaxID=1911570 RepID=UPI000D3AD2B2|nr:hypothetical protein [Mangrovicoccus ximenensis]